LRGGAPGRPAPTAGISGAESESPPGPGQSTDLTAITLNIWHDQPEWPARRAVILDTLRALAPDVIFLQEVLQKEGLPNQAATLAESLGAGWFFVSVDPPGVPKRYGNAILTRHRVLSTHEAKLNPLDDWRVAGHARIEAPGGPVDCYVTHLHHTTEGGAVRARQVADLLAFIDSTRAGAAVLVGGDFNAGPAAPELAPLRERFVDAWGRLHPGATDSATTTLNPAKGHRPIRIDYLFVDPAALRPVDATVILAAPAPDGTWASDHFGVWGRFRAGS
jgi:endonuclease/exonuclease/phosphatase family metal-dependent hydrolase